MNNTYSWVILKMECKKKEGSLINVVSKIYWIRNVINDIYNFQVQGEYYCPEPIGTDFTPYEDLTYEQICKWLESGINYAEIDLYLNSQIENKINPETIILPLPFKN